MTSDSKKPGVAFWATVVVVLLVGYPLSLGPACWITSRAKVGGGWVNIPYRPIIRLWEVGPEPVGDFVLWYSGIGATDDWGWTEHIDFAKSSHAFEWGPL